ncbi:MAG: hypothetical protein OXR68_08170, partial [Alphaproteobacteria bacterium]|nr:hypothetical protein [Alphaproteobacteria bacterium]
MIKRRISAFLVGLLALLGSVLHAAEWGNIATISQTTTGYICSHNGTNIDCAASNPFVDSAGNVTVTGSISATTYYGDGSNLTGISSSGNCQYVTGDRTSNLTIDDSGFAGTSESNLFDGGFSENSTDAVQFVSGAATNRYLRIEYTGDARISGFKWYQSTTDSQGTLDFRGSNTSNTGPWTTITSGISIGGSTSQIVTFSNSTNYKYYMWFWTGGSMSATPWVEEIELMECPGGDNLGNHTADQSINLGSYYLSGDGDNEGIAVTSAGDVSLTGMISATNLEVTGVITATTYYGDGSNLTGITVSELVSGTGSVAVLDDESVSVTVAGSSTIRINSGGTMVFGRGGPETNHWTATSDQLVARFMKEGDAFVEVKSLSNTLSGIEFTGAGYRGRVYTDGAYDMYLSPNDQYGRADVLFMPYNGANGMHVGIGTTGPGNSLTVVGDVSATTYYGDGSNLTGVTASAALNDLTDVSAT